MAISKRRPQKPKIRNFVAKHAKEVARSGAGPHKNPRLDYERHPRHKPSRSLDFTLEDDLDFDFQDLPDVFEDSAEVYSEISHNPRVRKPGLR